MNQVQISGIDIELILDDFFIYICGQIIKNWGILTILKATLI